MKKRNTVKWFHSSEARRFNLSLVFLKELHDIEMSLATLAPACSSLNWGKTGNEGVRKGLTHMYSITFEPLPSLSLKEKLFLGPTVLNAMLNEILC